MPDNQVYSFKDCLDVVIETFAARQKISVGLDEACLAPALARVHSYVSAGEIRSDLTISVDDPKYCNAVSKAHLHVIAKEVRDREGCINKILSGFFFLVQIAIAVASTS